MPALPPASSLRLPRLFAATAALLSLFTLHSSLFSSSPSSDYQTPGVVKNIPVFKDQILERATFPYSWLSGNYTNFAEWRATARERVRARWLTPPPPAASWDVRVIEEEDRGSYTVRKISLNLTADSRVLAYMAIPKGPGPFPAALILHSHGAEFRIGKEKEIRPINASSELQPVIDDHMRRYYGGKPIADTLAARGYVCFVTDAINFSDRGGDGFKGQAQLASNLMHLGMSFAGLIAWEDTRAAEFLATQPEVDSRRVAAIGFSLGSFRAWQLAATSDRIKAGVAICWMGDLRTFMTPENNHSQSPSAFTMLHPGLFTDLDYPDIASLACPKPMLFFNGAEDKLFPVSSVETAYAKMRAIWHSQAADASLVTRLWPGKAHIFDLEMQRAAFDWLDATMHTFIAPAAPPAAHSVPQKIIFDTDMTGDCDDAGALAVLHALADRGEAEILAIATNRKCSTNASAAACAAINTYYGRPSIPIGTDKDGGKMRNDIRSPYTEALRDEFPHNALPDDRMPDALAIYRRALASAPDGSVVICAVGALSNLEDLLRSGPDVHSPLTGRELIRRKVKHLAIMGGDFPRTRVPERNVELDTAAAATVANEWPTPQYWQGDTVGNAIITGTELQATPPANPVRRAYELRLTYGYTSLAIGKPSYDQATVLLAVRGPDSGYWDTTSGGHVVIDSEGHTRWAQGDTATGGATGHHYVTIKNRYPEPLRALIADLQSAPPKKPSDSTP